MELQDFVLSTASIVGFFSLCKILVKFLRLIWVMFLRPPKNLRDYGSWVLITGSTDGIGKALAFELASKGLNLILVGRNPSKLEETSTQIRKKYAAKVDIKSIVIDFAVFKGEQIAKAIKEGIEGLDVGIVINNAGLAYPYAKFFHEIDTKMIESLLMVNVEGPTWVTKAVLPGMLKKKKGAILNIGSGSTVAISSYPLYTVYAATKSYVELFSKSISVEYKHHGIDIQCQIPLLVATKMASIKRASFFIPSAETYSRASLRQIGYENLSMPYLPHYLQWCGSDLVPEAIQDWCIFRYFLGMRSRGMQKEAKAKQKKNP